MLGTRIAKWRNTCLGEMISTLIGPVGVSTVLCELVMSMVGSANCLCGVSQRGFQASSDLRRDSEWAKRIPMKCPE